MKLTDARIEALWEEHCPHQCDVFHDAISFARAILKEAGVEELERDAERYRWLRNNLGKRFSHWICAEGGEELDSQLDHDMKAK